MGATTNAPCYHHRRGEARSPGSHGGRRGRDGIGHYPGHLSSPRGPNLGAWASDTILVTGLAGDLGDRVRVWPYDGEPVSVRGTKLEPGDGVVWVLLADGAAAPADRVRLAAFGCPVCGACEGPAGDAVVTRPCGCP